MAIEVNWLNEDQEILVVKYWGQWTAAESLEADSRIRALLKSLTDTVDLIFDLRKNRYFPPGLQANANAVVKQEPYHNLGIVVITGDALNNEMVHLAFANAGSDPVKFFHAETLKDALAIIQREKKRR